MASGKLSNVIGAPFAEHILTQLNLRAAHNSTGDSSTLSRSNDDILFLANKMSWVKLTSSVRLTPEQYIEVNNITTTVYSKPIASFYKRLELDYVGGDDLAKNWTLEAGTSRANGANIDLRHGIGPDGAYGLGGTAELGYRPMPGLTSVIIDTKGTLGSLREATIQFKVWNMNQLNVIEALYFRLGYSMLLEWGHNQFFTNVNQQGVGGTFTTNTYGIDPFQPDLKKEIIQQQIAQRSYKLSGNYDGMLGVVTNFHWAFNQTGGYDCTVKLIGLGAIMDTLKINLSYVMPPSLFQEYKSQNETIQQAKERQAQIDAQNAEKQKRNSEGLPDLVAPASNNEGIKLIIASDSGVANVTDTELNNHAIPTYYLDTAGKGYLPTYVSKDYYYKAYKGGKNSNKAYAAELNIKRTGLFLNPIPGVRSAFQVLYIENPQSITLSKDVFNYTADHALDNLYIETPSYGRYERSDLNGVIDVVDTPIKLLELQLKRGETGIRFYYKVNTYNLSSNARNYTYINLNYQKPSSNAPTAEEVVQALQNWYSTKRTVKVDSFTLDGDRVVTQGTLEGVTLLYGSKKTPPVITIEFDNTALIEAVNTAPTPSAVVPQTTENANAGDTNGVANKPSDPQIDPGYRFASALHAMLAAAKSQVEFTMTSDQNGVVSVPLFEQTKKFFKGSIFEGLLNAQEKPDTNKFDLIQYARKGFNSNLMVNPDLFSKIEKVDFNSLTTAYGIRWSIQDDTDKINHPAYLKLGYVLSFLNAMCLIYDSTQDTDKNPYVYLDFNPNTNFCLTNPQHMSVDPFTCMIPFEGNQQDYLKLFPAEGDIVGTQLFGEELNAVSGYLPKFKTANTYQGQTMEILLNVDFLVEKLNARTSNSPDHAVDLKGFLDDIMTGINKATGNINSFRVSYRDDSNTVIIKDDQFVPPMVQEMTPTGWSMDIKASPSNYNVPNGLNVPKYGQLPIFGKKSLVRAMSFETDMTTKLSSIIAISGQSNTAAVNSTDHSAFSWLNSNFVDRYQPKISDSSTINSQLDNNQLTQEEQNTIEANSNKAASQFNQHVVSIYQGGVALSKDMVSAAVNYYINGMAKVKSEDGITVSAPFIPANINITIDGIAGIIMGNAFTIPEDRLPLSLRGQAGANRNTKVGFIVVGLTHTLDNNQWLTKIRGQMIRLRDSTDYRSTVRADQLPLNFIANVNTASTSATGPIGKCTYGVGCQRRSGNAYLSAKIMKDKAFTDAVDKITEDYRITDKTALYKVMYAESGLDPSNPNSITKSRLTGKTFAVGLIQFTPDNVITKDNPKGIIPSLDIIARTSPINQLPYVRKYLDQYPAIRGGGIYELYAAVFFPLALSHLKDPNWIIQSKDLSAYKVSYSNPAISCAAGKQPGEALTIADFKKYVDCIS